MITLNKLIGQRPKILPHTTNIKERLRRREEHPYNIPIKDYTGSYFEKIITQLKAPASRIP